MSNLNGSHIAVVDDTESTTQLFEAVLEAHGATVSSFLSGAAFLRSAAELNADLVLLDIQMPDMDGYKVLDQLKSVPGMGDTPVIALTAHAMSGDKEKILAHGFSAYIAKPVDTRSFPQQVAALLAG